MDVPATLTRKIGPLPVWAWGGVVGGGILVAKTLTGGGSSGASSPFVQPVGGALDFDPGAANGGAGSDTPPWWAQIPGVGTIIDRPPGDVTIIPDKPSTPPGTTTPPPAASLLQRLSLTGKTPIVDRTGKVIGTLGSGTFAVIKERIGNRTYWKITSTGASSGSTYTGGYIHATSDPTYRLLPATGDTGGDRGDPRYGDTRNGTPIASSTPVPLSSPVPLGARLAMPVYDAIPRGYGITVDALTPIASGARIGMPSVNGESTGKIKVPTIPAQEGMRTPWKPGRLTAPLRTIIDRWTPDTIPTTRPQRISYYLQPIAAPFARAFRRDNTG